MSPMREEYDIINELGSRNWLDVAAGEAVILGYFSSDVELEMLGTALAQRLNEVRFDDDNFFKVEAQATDLQERIERKKKEQGMILFIDEICEYEGGRKSLCKWEYGLTLAGGRYEITMMMPEYYGCPPNTEYRELIEDVIRASYSNPKFDELVIVNDSKIIGHQKMDTPKHYTVDGKLICRVVDFDHEDGPKRGMNIFYYFDEYAQVMNTWVKMKAILGTKFPLTWRGN